MCGTNIESTDHFVLQCSLYLCKRQTLMEKICDVEISILDQNENCLSYTLFFSSDKLNDVKNLSRLNATVEYIMSTKRSSLNNGNP